MVLMPIILEMHKIKNRSRGVQLERWFSTFIRRRINDSTKLKEWNEISKKENIFKIKMPSGGIPGLINRFELKDY
jgi:hypothetical protein